MPGPQPTLFLAGSQVGSNDVLGAQSGDVGGGVSNLSYNGGVQFGIVTDAALASDLQQITNYFLRELEKLVIQALMTE